MVKQCWVSGCDNQGKSAGGLCTTHRRRELKYGDPTLGPPVRQRAPDGQTREQCIARYTPRGLPDDQCWEWQGNINDTGYGRACYDGKVRNAHRVVAELKYGELPRHVVARHTCDNPPCVNPAHIVIGGQRDNIHDMRWGRSRKPNAKLTEQDVIAMRQRHASGVSAAQLGREFGVTPSTAWRVVTRRSWTYV